MQHTNYRPPEGRTLLIIGQGNDVVIDYVAASGVPPGGIMIYVHIANVARGLFSAGTGGNIRTDIPELLVRYPRTTMQLGLSLEGALGEVNSGVHDEEIRELARWIRQTQRPVFLRIGYECDGLHNRYDPGDYVRAFRRIASHLRDVHRVRNVATVWHSWAYEETYDGHPPNSWYPGDNFVDWVGVSLFEQVYSAGSGLQRAKELVHFANSRDKAIMIAESTPKGRGTNRQSWDEWFRPTIEFIESHDIAAWSYINSDWEAQDMWTGLGWGDARVQADPLVLERWLSEISSPRFMNSSLTLFQELGYEEEG